MWILGEVVQSRGSSLVGPHSLWTQQLGGSPRCNGRDKFKVKSVLLIGLNTGKCSNYLNLFLSSTCLGITYVTNFFGYLFNRWNLTRYLQAILIQRPGFSPSDRNRRKFPVIFQKCTIIVFVDSYSFKEMNTKSEYWIFKWNSESINTRSRVVFRAVGDFVLLHIRLCQILFWIITLQICTLNSALWRTRQSFVDK